MAATRSEEESTASALPTELLEDIGKRLNTKSDVSRFRAVCRSWRSSIPPVHPKLQTSFNINFWHKNNSSYIIKVREAAIYYELVSPAISPDEQVKRHWLVKLCPYPKERQACESMNLLDFNGFELAKAYEGVWKFVTSTNLDSPDFMLIYAGRLYHGKLGRDEHRDVDAYEVDFSFHRIEDVIFCQGMFYAVDSYGATVAVDSSLELTKIEFPSCSFLCTGDEMLLVESLGDLLLVESTVRTLVTNFRMFKLNAVEKKWDVVQASDLSDRILVVLDGESYLGHRGQSCGFSVAANDFPGCQGNCIYYYNSLIIIGCVEVFDLSDDTPRKVGCSVSDRLFLRSLRKETMNVS